MERGPGRQLQLPCFPEGLQGQEDESRHGRCVQEQSCHWRTEHLQQEAPERSMQLVEHLRCWQLFCRPVWMLSACSSAQPPGYAMKTDPLQQLRRQKPGVAERWQAMATCTSWSPFCGRSGTPAAGSCTAPPDADDGDGKAVHTLTLHFVICVGRRPLELQLRDAG